MYRWNERRQESSIARKSRAQFDFFLKQRERLLEEYQKYLDEPIPEDIDIKDED